MSKTQSDSKNRRSAAVSDAYLDLVHEFPLRPIRSTAEYDAAAQIVDRLALLDDALDPGQADYLETLELLIEAYDDLHHLLPKTVQTPLARLKYLMNEASMAPTELGDLLGSRPAASMILKGDRELSKAHIRKLADRFKVDAGLFL